MQQGLPIKAVVTRPDAPRGRSQKMLPSAVKQTVQDNWPHLPVFTPEKASTKEFEQQLKELHPNLFIVFAYGEILKENILSIPTHGCINIHGSLLPKYRGAAPIQRALMDGEKESGITIIEMVQKMDAGPMLEKAAVPISENMTFGELEAAIRELAGPTVLKAVEAIESGTVKKIPQNEEEVTFAPKIQFEDRVINWAKSAQEIHNQVRALSPRPGAICTVLSGGVEKKLGLKKTLLAHGTGQPGTTLQYGPDGWIVACGKGALTLLEVQLEGKKSLPIREFARGNPIPPQIQY